MVANAFRDDTFYLPHNMDFRGRAYTVAPHLSHIGSDLSRALLTFAESRPLGERGLFWLKVHVANLTGVDKVSFDDRVAFTEQNLHHVHDTATNPFGPPLNGASVKWWRGTDNPWQTLAVCMELHDALESGDPINFESSLPVHQDGTCNGLQHYAALGSDVEGATAVNLCSVPGSDRPSDVYMRVVDRVNEMVRAHAAGDFSGPNDVSNK
jgi:DNA-directed RNA polymerase